MKTSPLTQNTSFLSLKSRQCTQHSLGSPFMASQFQVAQTHDHQIALSTHIFICLRFDDPRLQCTTSLQVTCSSPVDYTLCLSRPSYLPTSMKLLCLTMFNSLIHPQFSLNNLLLMLLIVLFSSVIWPLLSYILSEIFKTISVSFKFEQFSDNFFTMF